jgi:hypothetical protein
MPPEPTQKTRPLVSTFMPSGTPGAAEDKSQNTRLLLRVPSGATSNARMRRWVQTSPRSASWKQRVEPADRYVKDRLIGRERQPIGVLTLVGGQVQVARRVDAKYARKSDLPQFRWQAQLGVGEKDAAVGAAHHIVGLIESFT